MVLRSNGPCCSCCDPTLLCMEILHVWSKAHRVTSHNMYITYGCCKIQFRRREWCKLICIMNHFMIPKMKKIQLRFAEHSWLVQKEMADHLSKKGHKLAKGKALALQWFPNDLYARRWLAHHHRWAIPFHWTSLAEGLRMATFWDGKFRLFRAAWLSHLQII